MITIYVLKCVNNKYYVGKTFNDHIKRFNIHKNYIFIE
jgi:predicted GIY-YIG superfamily endonuclease